MEGGRERREGKKERKEEEGKKERKEEEGKGNPPSLFALILWRSNVCFLMYFIISSLLIFSICYE